MQAKPFVKWAGGKTQLLPELKKNIPTRFKRYLEPFVGGGALLFEINARESLINDSNEELINCYEVIRDSPDKLIDDLQLHTNTKSYFYKVRSLKLQKLSSIKRASRFIYLNRTCYNGLWRVNKENQFNTPFGNYKNPKIVNAELIQSISKFLNSVKIFCMDFEAFLLLHAKKDDFIYLDPPYHPVSKYSDFKRYTKDFFGIEHQKRLAEIFRALDKKGCKLLLSNSYSPLILDLYSEFEIITVKARRSINNNGDGRGEIKEVVIRNYER